MSDADDFLPYGRQHITDADIMAVVDVLRSDWLTQGPAIENFEQALRELAQAPHAFAVNSATSALHIACLACGLGPGDIAWTSPNSFVASANAAAYCGASVDFVDIDPVSLNISVAALEAKLRQAETEGTLPKVLIPVHFAGQSCDMDAIGALARRYQFRVIEDASHSVGGRFGELPVGACEFSDATIFSFHPVKIVTTGEGGAVLTRDPLLADRVALLRSHGVTRREDWFEGHSHGPWYYQQIDLGFNYRMTDIQAALGASQLTRLAGYLARRHELGDLYDRHLADLPLTLPRRLPGRYSAFHLYVVQLDDPARRRGAFDMLRSAGIGVNVHYIPIHLQPFYRHRGFGEGDFPAAEAYYSKAITLPLHPRMTERDVERVATALGRALT